MTSAHPWLIAACTLSIGALSSTSYVALQYADLNARMTTLAQPGDITGAGGMTNSNGKRSPNGHARWPRPEIQPTRPRANYA
jgi:hypothetical protein